MSESLLLVRLTVYGRNCGANLKQVLCIHFDFPITEAYQTSCRECYY